jgi:hypothetical protein
MRFCLYSAVILLTIIVLGCKPKQTTVTGQIFIVTRGAENVKLGAVEVLLIEKPRATEFLQKKQRGIELQISGLQQTLCSLQEDARKAENAFNSFLTNDHYFSSNPEFRRINSEIERAIAASQVATQNDALERQWSLLREQQKRAEAQNDLATVNALGKQMVAVLEKQKEEARKVESLSVALTNFIQLGREAETNKFETAKSRLLNATALLEKTSTSTVEDYLADFSPVVFQKSISDADGKFSFAYPYGKSFAIVASAQRTVLDKTEKYYWLVDAPKNTKTAQVLLNNSNLIFVDPDGYFKLKPRQMQ